MVKKYSKNDQKIRFFITRDLQAYTSFGKKVKTVQKSLETRIPDLESGGSKSVASLLSEADLSPMPSPDYDAPSPEPDDDTELKLPDEKPEVFPEEQMSISEYLTKLAGQDQPQNGFYYAEEANNSAYYVDQG